MLVQVRTINVICAVLLVLAGFLIDNKVDARAIKRRSSDVSAEEYKRALVDALAYALVKSYGRREEPLWTETDTSGVAAPWTESSSSSDNTAPSGTGSDPFPVVDPFLWTETAIYNSHDTDNADTNNADPNIWTEGPPRNAMQLRGKGKGKGKQTTTKKPTGKKHH
ncbi:unnamed protein product [Adineta steineri]|uniref:Uncharacterized protein n=1 Tax=Adineta steineri TaxID=433720 RepID=A0A815HL58_9BILA|nr:unnamed protein product [Adineta steineri]